jgi:hypothetical protein
VAAAPASEIAVLTTRLNKLVREPPSRAQVRPIPSRLPRRNNRRLWQGRNLPPRMKQPDPTTWGPCSQTIASRMYATASPWLIVAMVRKRYQRRAQRHSVAGAGISLSTFEATPWASSFSTG